MDAAIVKRLIGCVISSMTKVIYENYAAEVASGLLSSTRFFVEAMTVAEARCLPVRPQLPLFRILCSLHRIESVLLRWLVINISMIIVVSTLF